MDPMRRELYVEGPSDGAFIKWIIGDSINLNARILSIDSVEMPGISDGGARARIIAFAKLVEGHPAQIRFFADADTDRLHNISVPTNVWLTDTRDMEGYLFREDCLDKLLRLGLGNENIQASRLLNTILEYGRTLGLLRLVSDEGGLNLPFQRTDMRRSLSCSKGKFNLVLDLDKYIKTLLQNVGLKQGLLASISKRIEEKRIALSNISHHEIVQGKDTLCLLEEVLYAHGIHRDDTVRILRTCFERKFADDYPSLSNAIRYLVT
jgi:hypothetical protein